MKNSKSKIAVLWNARCACTTVKNWFYFFGRRESTDEVVLYNGERVLLPGDDIHHVIKQKQVYAPDLAALEELGYKVALVVRDPVSRFISMCVHPCLFAPNLMRKFPCEAPEETALRLLQLLEEGGTLLDHHTYPQAWLGERLAVGDDLHGVQIIRCEDDVLAGLNSFFGESCMLVSEKNKRMNRTPASRKFAVSGGIKQRIRDVYERDCALFGY